MLKSEIDTEVLIAVVGCRPVLWDNTCEEYKDREATKEAWDEVCNILNNDFQSKSEKDKSAFMKEVLKRWANLRDAFKKFCKREKELEKSGEGMPKFKKYVYHKELRFLRKLFDPENAEAEENYENDDPQFDVNKLIPTVHLQTWSDDMETSEANPRGPRTRSQDTETASGPRTQDTEVDTSVSDAGGDDNFYAETMSSTSQLSSGSVAYKRKRSGGSGRKKSKVFDGEKSERHLSFFKGIVPSLEEFNEQEVLKFQIGVLQLISSIKDQKHRASQTQLPAQFLSFPQQPGPSAYRPSAPPCPSGQQIYPTLWSAACSKCGTASSPSKNVE